MGSIPSVATEVSAAEVTAMLREGGAIGSDTEVAEVSATAIGEGVGIVGQLARLTLRYDGHAAGAPSSVILKIPSQYPQNRAIGDHFNFYEREGRFYQQLAGKIPVRVPRCYANHLDPSTGEFALLLEDFGDRTMISQVAGVGPERAVDAVASIARVHADFWESPALDGLDWMPTLTDPVNLAAGQQYRDSWGAFVDGVGDELPPGALALGERIQEQWEQLATDGFGRLPTTVVHGDFRVDNLMFDDAAADDERVGVIDWQISFRGPAVNDVSYFLTQSMDERVCRDSERRIVDAWYDALADRAGGEPTGFSRGEAWDEYRASLLGVTVYPVTGAGSMDLANERGRQLVVAMARRAFGGALALGSEEFLEP